MSEDVKQSKSQDRVGEPLIAVAWDPKLVSQEQYSKLIVALGNLIRAEGGAGIERVRAKGFGVHVAEGANV